MIHQEEPEPSKGEDFDSILRAGVEDIYDIPIFVLLIFGVVFHVRCNPIFDLALR